MEAAITMARDLADRSLAREITLAALGKVQGVPADQRRAIIEPFMQKRIGEEAIQFTERLMRQIENVMREANQQLRKSELVGAGLAKSIVEQHAGQIGAQG